MCLNIHENSTVSQVHCVQSFINFMHNKFELDTILQHINYAHHNIIVESGLILFLLLNSYGYFALSVILILLPRYFSIND